MHIICLPSWYPNRYNENSGIFIKKHINILAENHDLNVLYIHADSEKQNFEPELELIQELNYKEFKLYYKKTNILLDTYYHLKCLINGYKLIVEQSEKPQLCHLFVAYPAGIGALYLKLFYRLPYIITEHWSGYTSYDGRFFRYSVLIKKIIRKIYSNALHLSVISYFLGESILSIKLVKEYFLTNNYIKFPSQQQSNKAASKFRILSIASLDDFTKNITGMINAIIIVKQKYPDIILEILGDGDDKDFLIKYAKDRDLLDINIKFIGTIDNHQVQKLYKNYSFFILNSNFETFSIATVEAIANGLPVIVTRCGGPEEFVNENNGILIDRHNPQQLSKAIEYMIKNYQKYDKVSMYDEIRNRYSEETVRSQLNNFYNIAASKLGL
jgi:glycosyltransferase involved in cell wall biosynthesis